MLHDLAIKLLDAEANNQANARTIKGQAELLRMGVLTRMDSILGGVDALDGFARDMESDARARVERVNKILNSTSKLEEVQGLTIFTLSETIDALRDIAGILKSGGMPLELLIENLENIATVNEIHRARLETISKSMEDLSDGQQED